MRLKEDRSSYKSSNIERRDFRRSPIEDDFVPHTKKRNTRRWCKGKVGQEHDFRLIDKTKIFRFTWKTYRCEICKKKVLK